MKPAFAKATARKLLFATTNPNKLKEVRRALPCELIALADVSPVPEPDESGATFWANARIKALAYADATGLTTVAEDSGFEIDALGGAPGVQSARFLGPTASYPDRFAEIYRRLSADKPKGLSPHTPSGGDKPLGLSLSARFVTALAVARGHELLFETETSIEGTVANAPSGHHGFGYDPIFWYPPFGRTTADLSEAEKAAVSHRARAFRDLRRWLTTQSDSPS
jgi:XTP/dITP diphosphohydrolase